jgi:hypothetical protein
VKRSFPAGNQVEVGDLQPGDDVTVRVWGGGYSHDPDEVSKVRVSHEDGIARIKPQYLVGKFWYQLVFIIRILMTLFIAAIVVTALTALVALAVTLYTATPRPGTLASPTPTPVQATPPN